MTDRVLVFLAAGFEEIEVPASGLSAELTSV